MVTDTQTKKYVNFDKRLHKVRMKTGVFIVAKILITFSGKRLCYITFAFTNILFILIFSAL